MLKKRIIPCLDIKGDQVVKGVRFKDLRPLADPYDLARHYNNTGADELVLYDITASLEDRAITTSLIDRIASTMQIPLTVGGGIHSLDDVKRLFAVGADKVSINSGAIKKPALISLAAKCYGTQSIVGSMDVAFNKATGAYLVYTGGGRVATGLEAVAWAKRLVDLGAGELVVNSIDQDGLGSGFDLKCLEAISEAVAVPIIASGGAGAIAHFEAVLGLSRVTGALAATLFHEGILEIPVLKTALQSKGVPMRCLT